MRRPSGVTSRRCLPLSIHFSLPPPTKWTRRVPHPVLIGHAASLCGLRLLSGNVSVVSNPFEPLRGAAQEVMRLLDVNLSGRITPECLLHRLAWEHLESPPSLLLPLPVSLLCTHSLPTVAPTRVPTVHSLPPYCCPYPCPYCTLTHSLPSRFPSLQDMLARLFQVGAPPPRMQAAPGFPLRPWAASVARCLTRVGCRHER